MATKYCCRLSVFYARSDFPYRTSTIEVVLTKDSGADVVCDIERYLYLGLSFSRFLLVGFISPAEVVVSEYV